MQVTPYPSRRAPLCKSCTHALTYSNSTKLWCNHPATPVDPVTGQLTVAAEQMRLAAGLRFSHTGPDTCGPSGLLFAQRVGDVAQRDNTPFSN
jgi:hypothetical protein